MLVYQQELPFHNVLLSGLQSQLENGSKNIGNVSSYLFQKEGTKPLAYPSQLSKLLAIKVMFTASEINKDFLYHRSIS